MKISVYEQNNNIFNSFSLFNVPYASGYNPQGLAIGDINNDGRKDIAIADYNNGLVILYNSSTLNSIENTIKSNVIIYPNPTKEYLNIYNSKSLQLTYTITDINGKIIKEGNTTPPTINVIPLQSGFYFLTLQNEQEKTTYKFIKN